MTYVEVQPLAEQELAEAAGWYEEQAPGVGLEFLRAVDATFAAIGREPSMFPLMYRDLRRALLRRFPYKVYFVVRDDRVTVVAVVHGRRHPRVWRRRA